MKLIVDANIVFSALLNTNGKIGDILIKSKTRFQFIAPDFLRVEIKKHYKKISKISGLTLDEIRESEFQIYHNIQFISEEQIPDKHWQSAINLKCKIWSGDKELIKGLTKKGFTNFVTTNELFELR